MEEYIFTPIDVVIHWYVRLRSWFISKHDKRVLYKQFSAELHIDKLKKEDISYALPESYLVVTNEIRQLYNVRDEILIKIHEKDYSKKQISIDIRIKALENEIKLLEDRYADEKSSYTKLRGRLTRNKFASEDLIALQSRVSQAYSKFSNTNKAIKNYKNLIATLVSTKKQNLDNWEKQIKLVEKVVDDAINRYIKRATKKIETAYGFTVFAYEVTKYKAELEKIIKGEY